MSPVPGRSTLITSAPNQASSCVQVGPDCTCVKSRMRTPSSAFDISIPLTLLGVSSGGPLASGPRLSLPSARLLRRLLLERALRVEVADAAALASRRRVDHRVDQGRLAGIHGRV